jgi:hypothetical protein
VRDLKKYILAAALAVTFVLVYLNSSLSISLPTTVIDQITVQDRAGELLRDIRDPEEINGVVGLTASHSDGWSRPSRIFTSPSSEYTLRFYSNRVCQYELLIGREHLGWNSFQAGAGRSMSKSISPLERAELLGSLGALKE